MTTDRPVRPDDASDGPGAVDRPGEHEARRDLQDVPAVLRPIARAVRAVERRGERLERAVERRWPLLYDLRHAAGGIGRLVGPLIGAVLTFAILAPLVALLAILAAVVLGGLAAVLALLGVDPPAFDLPEIDLPSVGVPGWLEAVGGVVAIFDGIADVGNALKWPLIAVLVLGGVLRSRDAVRRRAAAGRIGRDELLRRLAASLAAVETVARDRDARNVGEVAETPDPVALPARDRRRRPHDDGRTARDP